MKRRFLLSVVVGLIYGVVHGRAANTTTATACVWEFNKEHSLLIDPPATFSWDKRDVAPLYDPATNTNWTLTWDGDCTASLSGNYHKQLGEQASVVNFEWDNSESELTPPPTEYFDNNYVTGALGVDLNMHGKDGDAHNFARVQLLCGVSTAITASNVYRILDSEWSVTLSSARFCPIECPRTPEGDVCSGHGLCNLDMTLRAPRCHCFAQHTGDDCATPLVIVPVRSATGGVLALIFVLIGLLVVLVGLTFQMIRRLNTDDVRYNTLAVGDHTAPAIDSKDLGGDDS